VPCFFDRDVHLNALLGHRFPEHLWGLEFNAVIAATHDPAVPGVPVGDDRRIGVVNVLSRLAVLVRLPPHGMDGPTCPVERVIEGLVVTPGLR
jgi:hypothetical protein